MWPSCSIERQSALPQVHDDANDEPRQVGGGDGGGLLSIEDDDAPPDLNEDSDNTDEVDDDEALAREAMIDLLTIGLGDGPPAEEVANEQAPPGGGAEVPPRPAPAPMDAGPVAGPAGSRPAAGLRGASGQHAAPGAPPLLTAGADEDAPARRRGKATVSASFCGGVLAFYESNRVFQASCGNAFHGACILTRKNTKNANMSGRPLGLLAAWLEQSALHETKEEHWAVIADIAGDRALRASRRRALCETDEGKALAEHEHPTPPGQDADGEPF